MEEAEDRIDQVFIRAFDANHPAMIDWVTIKFKLKELTQLQKENDELRTALILFTEYIEVYGDRPFYAIPRVKMMTAKEVLYKKEVDAG